MSCALPATHRESDQVDGVRPRASTSRSMSVASPPVSYGGAPGGKVVDAPVSRWSCGAPASRRRRAARRTRPPTSPSTPRRPRSGAATGRRPRRTSARRASRRQPGRGQGRTWRRACSGRPGRTADLLGASPSRSPRSRRPGSWNCPRRPGPRPHVGGALPDPPPTRRLETAAPGGLVVGDPHLNLTPGPSPQDHPPPHLPPSPPAGLVNPPTPSLPALLRHELRVVATPCPAQPVHSTDAADSTSSSDSQCRSASKAAWPPRSPNSRLVQRM